MHGWVRASLYALWPAGGLLALIARERAQMEARLHLTEVRPQSRQAELGSAPRSFFVVWEVRHSCNFRYTGTGPVLEMAGSTTSAGEL